MYIENFRTRQENRKVEPTEADSNQGKEQMENEEMSGRLSDNVLYRWQAPEYESYSRDKKWYAVMTLGLLAIVTYAFFTNSPLMAITFILIGIIEYIYISREPKILDFYITPKGIVVGNEIYEFEQMKSFWIFYDPETIKSLSLRIKSGVVPFLQIPLNNADPNEIHQILIQYLPEIEQEYRLRDSISRMLRL